MPEPRRRGAALRLTSLGLLSVSVLLSLVGCVHARGLIEPRSGAQGARARFNMSNGMLYVMRDWSRENAWFYGTGEQYDIDRRLLDSGRFRLPAQEVSAVEVSEPRAGAATAATTALVLLSAASVAVTGVCVLVPSTGCYGAPR